MTAADARVEVDEDPSVPVAEAAEQQTDDEVQGAGQKR
jgi:small conductance mechanosensitive channel